MSDFPPAHHVIRDLAMTSQLVAPSRHVSVAPVPDGVRDRSGRAGAGFLATFVDASAGLVVLTAARPDWSATADLELHLTDHIAVGSVVADVRLARAGSRLVVVRATVHDAGAADAESILDGAAADPSRPVEGPVVATGVLSFVRMPASRSLAADLFDHDALADRRSIGAGEAPAAPIAERVGARAVGGGVEIEGSPYVRNSMGAITGGVHGLAAQLAAETACPGASVTDLTVHFLAAARVGPLRADARVLRSGAAVDVDVVDAGSGDLVSLASAVLAPTPAERTRG